MKHHLRSLCRIVRGPLLSLACAAVVNVGVAAAAPGIPPAANSTPTCTTTVVALATTDVKLPCLPEVGQIQVIIVGNTGPDNTQAGVRPAIVEARLRGARLEVVA